MSDLPMYNWCPGAQPHYITDAATADVLIARYLEHHVGHVGFDLEWKPSFVRGARENPVALVQIATKTEVFLFQLSAMFAVPSSLKDFLENSSIIKVGVGIQSPSFQQLCSPLAKLFFYRRRQKIISGSQTLSAILCRP